MSKFNLVPSKKSSVEKVLSTYKKPHVSKQAVRALSANKGKVAVVGAVVATVATGVGILATVGVKKKREREAEKVQLQELEAENQHLVSLVSTLISESIRNKDTVKKANVSKEDVTKDSGIPVPLTEDDAITYDEDYKAYENELAESLVKDGESLLKRYQPNETIVFSEADFLEGVTEAPEFDEDLEALSEYAIVDGFDDVVYEPELLTGAEDDKGDSDKGDSDKGDSDKDETDSEDEKESDKESEFEKDTKDNASK